MFRCQVISALEFEMIESHEFNIDELSFDEFIEYCNNLNSIDEKDSYDSTLLLAACSLRKIEFIGYVLQKNGNVDYLDECGETPLLTVIDSVIDDEEVSLEIVELLINVGANLELKGYMDKTPYLKACSRDSLKMIKLLVKYGANTKATVNEYGYSYNAYYFSGVHELSHESRQYIKSIS